MFSWLLGAPESRFEGFISQRLAGPRAPGVQHIVTDVQGVGGKVGKIEVKFDPSFAGVI